jgi:hypothetical protein
MKEPIMTTSALPRVASGQSDLLQDKVQDELRHIRDLIFIRDLLDERGEPSTVLRKCDAVINEARTQLAESTKRASARYATAA